jgi:hypothetical protein
MSSEKLTSKIAVREGKKKQVAIGNIREVVARCEDVMAEEAAVASFKDGLGVNSVTAWSSRSFNQFETRVHNKAKKVLRALIKAQAAKDKAAR